MIFWRTKKAAIRTNSAMARPNCLAFKTSMLAQRLVVAILVFGAIARIGLVCDAAEKAKPEDLQFFREKIHPLLETRCFKCHSHLAEKLKAGLFLDSRSGILQGGDSGAAIQPGAPEKSLLIHAVHYEDVDLQMPPKTKLPDGEITLLEDWIKRGAPWPDDVGVPKGLANSIKVFNLEARRESHWAWQPVKKVEPPRVELSSWPEQPVDNFVLAKLEEQKLRPAPEADRRTLIRRLSFVLNGLPPTPAEVRAFEQDSSPDACDKLVQRLLDSPRFGERWARHWLDVVRYSETLGHEFDYAMPNAWRYRDYVIRAINEDIPYNQFVREHIAGDLMEHPRRDPATGQNESLTATGFFWFGQQAHSPVDIKASQLDLMDNQIDTLMRGFQGLTVSCARCHDHKFDAISTKDFYALYGVLASSRYVQADADAREVITDEVAALQKIRAAVVRQAGGEVGTQQKAPSILPVSNIPGLNATHWFTSGAAMKDSLVDVGDVLFVGPTNSIFRTTVPLVSSRKLSPYLDGALRSPNFVITNRYLHVRVAGHNSRAKLVMENFQLIQDPIYGGLKKVINCDDLQWITFDLEMWPGRRAYLEFLDSSTPDLAGMAMAGVSTDGWFDVAEVVASNDAKAPERPAAYNPMDVSDAAKEALGEIAKLHERTPAPIVVPAMADSEGIDQPVLIRGGPAKPGEHVERRFLEALGGLDHPVTHGSGRDVIADLIVSPDNPLTARVWVNRVWHHLFGRGIVATVDDFGKLGERPSHPELLDWLANWFVTEGQWSTKKLITMLVTSSTWKQSAIAADGQFDVADAQNVLLHKWTVRRLEGEAIRDTILAVSGRLKLEMYGPSVPVYLTDFMTGRGRPAKSGPLDGDGRRSVYLEMRRNFMPPMMLAFDTPQAAKTFGRRAESNVPAQALILMNDPFVQDQARLWSKRLLEHCGDNTKERVDWLYEQAFQRRPTGEEGNDALAFLNEQATELPSVSTSAIPPTAWSDLCHVLLNTKEFVFVN